MGEESGSHHPDFSPLFFPMTTVLVSAIINVVTRRINCFHIPDVVYQFAVSCTLSIAVHYFLPSKQMEDFDVKYAWGGMHPQSVIIMLLPPLLFECTINLNTYMFFTYFKTVLFVSFTVYFFTFLLSGCIFYYIFFFIQDYNVWTFSMLLSGILASVDPATTSPVVADSRAPLRLRMFMEGESAITDSLGLFMITVLNKYHLSSQSEGSLTAEDGKEFLRSFVACFGVSPFIGILAGHLTQRILCHSGMMDKMKHLLLLVVVYFVFYIGECISGSAAVTIVAFGITIASMKEEFEAHFWNHVEFFWELLSSLSTTLIFFFCGYRVGMQLIDRQHSIYGAGETATYPSLFAALIIAMFMSLVPMMSRALGMFIAYSCLKDEEDARVRRTEFALMAWGGMRGGLALLMALTLSSERHDSEGPFYLRLLLYTCGCVLPSILLQGSTFGNAVYLFGANLRSSYSRKSAWRLKTYLKRELAVKMQSLRQHSGEFLRGANWDTVNEYLVDSLFNLPNRDCNDLGLGDNSVMAIEENDDERDVFRTYYGMMLAYVNHEWHRGAASGATAVAINGLLEHAIDEGFIVGSDVQSHIDKLRVSTALRYLCKLVYVCVMWIDCGFSRRLSQITRQSFHKRKRKKEEAEKAQIAVRRTTEFWWIVSTLFAVIHSSIVIYAALNTYCPFCVPFLLFSMLMSSFWIVEHSCLFYFCLFETDRVQRFLNLVYSLILMVFAGFEFVVSCYLIWPRHERSHVVYLYHTCLDVECRFTDEFNKCTLWRFLLAGVSVAFAVLKLIRSVPISVFLAGEVIIERQLTLERIRLSVLNCLQHMTSEIKFSKELFPTTLAYNLALSANRDFREIIDCFLRTDLRLDSAEMDVMPVIKTRQALRMIGYELQQSVTALVEAGFTEEESLEKWMHRIQSLREYADNLINVPEVTTAEKLKDVDWVFTLNVAQRDLVIQKLAEIIDASPVECVEAHGTVSTQGINLFYIKRGLCRVFEETVPQTSISRHTYYIGNGGFIGLKNVYKHDSTLKPHKVIHTMYNACTAIDLVRLNSSVWVNFFNEYPDGWRTISMAEQKRRLLVDLKKHSREYNLMSDTEIIAQGLNFVEVKYKVIIKLCTGDIMFPGVALNLQTHPHSAVDKYLNIQGPAKVVVEPTSSNVVGIYVVLNNPSKSAEAS